MVATLKQPHAAALAQGQCQCCSPLAQHVIGAGLKLQPGKGVSPVGIIACSTTRRNPAMPKISNCPYGSATITCKRLGKGATCTMLTGRPEQMLLQVQSPHWHPCTPSHSLATMYTISLTGNHVLRTPSHSLATMYTISLTGNHVLRTPSHSQGNSGGHCAGQQHRHKTLPALQRMISGWNLQAAGSITLCHTDSMLSCPASPGRGTLMV
jgi:hypothetical protein